MVVNAVPDDSIAENFGFELYESNIGFKIGKTDTKTK